MNRLLGYLAALLASVALLLGYFWPIGTLAPEQGQASPWQSLSSSDLPEVVPQPQLLTRFWPINEPEEKSASSQPTDSPPKLRLIGIIQQGQHYRAQLLTREGKVVSLGVGDPLNLEHTISAINATSVHWQGRAAHQQGKLQLYPKPAPLSSPSTHE